MPTPTNCERYGHVYFGGGCLRCGWSGWIVHPDVRVTLVPIDDPTSLAKPQAPRDTPDRSGESAEQALETMR